MKFQVSVLMLLMFSGCQSISAEKESGPVWIEGPDGSLVSIRERGEGGGEPIFYTRCWKMANGYDCLQLLSESPMPQRWVQKNDPRKDDPYLDSGYRCAWHDGSAPYFSEMIEKKGEFIRANVILAPNGEVGTAWTSTFVEKWSNENRVKTTRKWFDCSALRDLIREQGFIVFKTTDLNLDLLNGKSSPSVAEE